MNDPSVIAALSAVGVSVMLVHMGRILAHASLDMGHADAVAVFNRLVVIAALLWSRLRCLDLLHMLFGFPSKVSTARCFEDCMRFGFGFEPKSCLPLPFGACDSSGCFIRCQTQ